MGHVTAFMPPVPEQIRARYVAMARLGREVDVPEDKLASFPMAVKRETSEKRPRGQEMGETPFSGRP